MRTSVLSLGALALGLASAHEYPNCESDNCFRNLVDERFAAQAVAWCPEFLSGTTTASGAIPTEFSNCDGNVQAVSSACSCITYTASATATPTATPSSSSTSVEETSSEAPGTTTATTEAPATSTEEPETSDCETETEEPESSTSTTKWTTSTITTSTTKTITQCPASVTACPGRSTTFTTVEVVVTTTVCPVTEEPSAIPTITPPVLVPSSSAFGTVTVKPPTTGGPKPTSSIPVTAGAGRAVRGVEGIAAIAGLFAAFL
ncbi:putative cell wall protein sed1 protein [Staphylotrichum tortipilum]|uniref:Cell wall protein sed1 protein n=1 Tax=Staphylotrichum tortipilum TaxID=2831512 RepID=A0AAN6MTF7_9PEZI|nr:putative cell wall protein sed1 protein [Staphylotrichum longicolle]